MIFKKINILIFILCFAQAVPAQNRGGIKWTANGNYYTQIKDGSIIQVDPLTEAESVIIRKEQLVVPETNQALAPQSYAFNTAKVWRYRTRGDYWVLDIISNKLKKLGKGLPEQSLMFAKFSPDGKKVA